jgi:hypothetical protein
LKNNLVVVEMKFLGGEEAKSWLMKKWLARFESKVTEQSIYRVVFEMDLEKNSLYEVMCDCEKIKHGREVAGFVYSVKSATLEHLFFKHIKKEQDQERGVNNSLW